MYRKNNKKGFTLVEVIVVLVILAILAAIMIPAMTGWIDKANERAILAEARTALLAAQTCASENYGGVAYADDLITDANALANFTTGGSITSVSEASGVVTALVYTDANNRTATYSSTTGDWTVSD